MTLNKNHNDKQQKKTGGFLIAIEILSKRVLTVLPVKLMVYPEHMKKSLY